MRIDIQPYDYRPGSPYAQCPICGFRCRLNSMKLRWDGFWVCPADYDPRPEQLTPPVVFAEGLPRPNAQPEMPNEFVNFDIGPEDLP